PPRCTRGSSGSGRRALPHATRSSSRLLAGCYHGSDTSMGEARRLYWLGFLTLFLELVFIRFLAGDVWNLGDFPNLLLVSVFVGMGLGFVGHRVLDEDRSAKVFLVGAWVLAVLLGFVAVFRPRVPGFGENGSEFRGELFFSRAPAARETEILPFVICFL